MNRQEKIRYLSRYRNLEKEITQKREQILKWKSEAEKVTTILSDLPKAKSREIEDRNAEIVAKMIDLHYELNQDISILIDLKKEIEGVISNLDNPTYRLLLTKRYIDCKKWELIAVEMNYSYRGVHKIHKIALDRLKCAHFSSIKDDIM